MSYNCMGDGGNDLIDCFFAEEKCMDVMKEVVRATSGARTRGEFTQAAEIGCG